MGCTSSSESEPIMPTLVGEYSGTVSKAEVSYGIEFVNNSGNEVTIFYCQGGREHEAKTISNGEKYYINSKKIGLNYKCKAQPSNQVIGNYTS